MLFPPCSSMNMFTVGNYTNNPRLCIIKQLAFVFIYIYIYISLAISIQTLYHVCREIAPIFHDLPRKMCNGSQLTMHEVHLSCHNFIQATRHIYHNYKTDLVNTLQVYPLSWFCMFLNLIEM